MILKKTWIVLLLGLGPLLSLAQTGDDGQLRIFIDCRTRCDQNFFRQELTFVDHVRDRVIADVLIQINDFQSGNGAQAFNIQFFGQKEQKGMDFELNHTPQPTAPDDEIRRGILQKIKIGLVPYLSSTPLLDKMEVTVDHEPISTKDKTPLQLAEDPWKFWVFELRANGNVNLEAQRKRSNWRFRTEANNVREEFKFFQMAYLNLNNQLYIDDEEEYRSELISYGTWGRFVKSINEHWSVGFTENFEHSTFENIDLSVSAGPAVEFSLFPYDEFNTRQITIAYFTRFYHRQYIEESIFSKMRENLVDQALRVEIRYRKPWGSFRSVLEGRHFFHDFSKNSVQFENNLSFQIIKGLSFDVNFDFSFINDQLSLPRGEASLEDLLLQQRQLATNYELQFGFGVNYVFGSIYNNVINPRL